MHLPYSSKLTHEEVQYIVIDLFSGAGGTSTGIERAYIDGNKVAVVIAAVNHDPVAIQSHSLNHRFAVHFIEDVRNIAFWQLAALVSMYRKLYPNAKLVIWASAECTNYSKAKGGQPRDADSRTLPQALYEYVDYFKPDILQVENVVEFMSWGEMDEKGRPISKLAGTDYLRWVEKIRSYGYDYSYRILNAADFGAYTSRVRYFGQFVKHAESFVWPEPTHSKSPKRDMFSHMEKWKPVKEVLDLFDEGKSIFDRKKPYCEKTLKRLYSGLVKYVPKGESFIAAYYSNGDNVSSVNSPSPTVRTKDGLSVVNPVYLMNYYTGGGELSDINNPCPALTSIPKQRLVSPKFIDQQYGNSKPIGIDEPAGALTGNPKLSLVSAKWLMDTSFNNKGTGIDEPAPTILACRKHHYLVNPQYKSAGGSIENPCFTLIARMDKMPPSIVTAETGETAIIIYENDSEWTKKIKVFMSENGLVDIKMRMLKIPEMLRIMGFGDEYKLAGTDTNKKKFIGNAVHTIIPQKWYEAMAMNNNEKREAV